MKIGILTFHFVENYGGVLQAYALERFLLNCGYEVEIIDYRPEYLVKKYRLFDDYYRKTFHEKKYILFFKLTLYNLLTLKDKIRKKKAFRDFLDNYLILSEEKELTDSRLVGKILNNYDVVVCGSDQIWNGDITEGLDSIYFAYASGFKKKKISYAASIGKTDISMSDFALAERYINEFDLVTVREEDCRRVFRKIRNDILVVCDPVFLLDCNMWRDYLGYKEIHGKKGYILLYKMEHNSLLDTLVKELSIRYALPIKEISLNRDLKKKRTGVICDADPKSFVEFVDGADVVVTNSFHACAFSILFHKELYVVHHSVRGSRTRYLLKRYGINCLKYAEGVNYIDKANIDWNEIDRRIALDRKQSYEIFKFLREELNESRD